MHRRRPHPVRVLMQIVALVLVVYVFVLPQLGGARAALDRVASLSPWLIVVAGGLEALALVVYAELAWRLFPGDVRPSRLTCNGAVLASTAVNHVIPGGAATTAAVNLRLYGRVGVPTDRVGFVLTTQAVGSAIVLNVILWIAMLVSIPTSGLHPAYVIAVAVGAGIMALAALVIAALVRGSRRLKAVLTFIAQRVKRFDPERVDGAVHGIALQLLGLARDRSRLALLVGLAAGNWLLDSAALWVCLTAFGHRPDVVGLLVAYGLANVMAALPVTPGGLGVVEAVLIPTLIGFGNPVSVVAVGVVAYRLLNFWLPIPLGLLCYVLVERFAARVAPQSEPSTGVGPFLDEMLARRRRRSANEHPDTTRVDGPPAAPRAERPTAAHTADDSR